MINSTNFGLLVLVNVLFGQLAYASLESTGPNGINSSGLGLTGNGVGIGQVETSRPGDPKDDSMPGPPGFDTSFFRFNSSIDPERVFYASIDPPITGTLSFSATANAASETGLGHATAVAGVMISTDTTLVGNDSTVGVSPQADLFSAGNDFSTFFSSEYGAAVAGQLIATQNNGNIRAINMSVGLPLTTLLPNGTSTISSFVDWSSRVHDALYVAAGPYTSSDPNSANIRMPADNFNGITVAMSRKNGNGKFSTVDDRNVVIPSTERTYVDIIAPGVDVLFATQGNGTQTSFGTSISAPHVTGTVALLQQYGDERIANAGVPPQWNANARHHEVMKAVLMNSADKLIDNGTIMHEGNLVPQGKLLGMERTVLKQNGDKWFDSDAYLDDKGFGEFFDEDTPLDEEMGTGHLNAKRALQQFLPGEHDFNGTDDGNPLVGDVPAIGWDYGTISGTNYPVNKYLIDETLTAGNFISITLAWDREVEFANDANMDGNFDVGDTFESYTDLDDVLTNLDLYLVPAGTDGVGEDDIAISNSEVTAVEHVFTEIPFDGDFEIWVLKNEQFGPAQDYGLAWWYGLAPELTTPNTLGDFDGDGNVDATDLAQWQGDYGLNGDSDADNDNDSDGADFLAWQRNFGTSALAASSAVPEPTSFALLILGLPLLMKRNGKRSV